MIAAVFFPADHLPEDFDLQSIAFQAEQAGLHLYYNGRQHALLPRVAGDYLPVTTTYQENPQCVA